MWQHCGYVWLGLGTKTKDHGLGLNDHFVTIAETCGVCFYWMSFTVQSDVCAEFDTRRLFSHPAAESGKFLCAH